MTSDHRSGFPGDFQMITLLSFRAKCHRFIVKAPVFQQGCNPPTLSEGRVTPEVERVGKLCSHSQDDFAPRTGGHYPLVSPGGFVKPESCVNDGIERAVLKA